MIYSEFSNVKNIHRVFFLEFFNCHRIYAQTYVIDGKYYINNTYKIIYLLQGSLVLEEEDVPHKLKKGDMYTIAPNIYHRTRKTSDDETIFIGFELDLIALSKKYNIDSNYLYRGIVNDKELIYNISYILRILLKARISSSYSNIEVVQSLKKLINLLKVNIDVKNRKNSLTKTEKLIVKITRDLPIRIKSGRDLRLKTIAKEEGISYYYLSKKFKEFIGVSYREYLLEKQMIVFINFLLLNIDKSIADLAYDSGYKSLSSFNKDFKRFFNITPTEMIDIYLDILNDKIRAYKHPVIVSFLNHMDSMDSEYADDDLLLDFTGMCEMISNRESYDLLKCIYKTIIYKLENSKDKNLLIFYGHEDYIHFLNSCESDLKVEIISAVTKILNICDSNNIKVIIKIQ